MTIFWGHMKPSKVKHSQAKQNNAIPSKVNQRKTYVEVYVCLHVHACVCMYTCMYMCVCMILRKSTRMCLCACRCMCMCMSVCVYVYVYVYQHVVFAKVFIMMFQPATDSDNAPAAAAATVPPAGQCVTFYNWKMRHRSAVCFTQHGFQPPTVFSTTPSWFQFGFNRLGWNECGVNLVSTFFYWVSTIWCLKWVWSRHGFNLVSICF